jgi:hypothetical protein
MPNKSIEKLKEEHPGIADAFEQIMAEQYELFAQKMLDYGKGNISVGSELQNDDEVKLALTGLFFRMNDKVQRIKNLVALNKERHVKGEAIQDTFQDLSIYGIIAQIVAAGRWK